jgi:hypothetical protein
MPCVSDPPDWGAEIEKWKEKLDLVTSVACEMGDALNKSGALTRLSDPTKRWYREHKAWDAKRQQAEKRDREETQRIEKLKSSALRKLSKEELKALLRRD